MTNPKASTVRRVGNEQQSPRDTMARRLRGVGATHDEIEAFLESWDRLDDDWTEQARYAFIHLGDAKLKEALQQIRAEYPFEEERRGEVLDGAPDAVAIGAFARDETPAPQMLPDDAPGIRDSIALLEKWVGDDRERAQLVHDAEVLDAQMRSQTPRKTLLLKMQAVVDA